MFEYLSFDSRGRKTIACMGQRKEDMQMDIAVYRLQPG